MSGFPFRPALGWMALGNDPCARPDFLMLLLVSRCPLDHVKVGPGQCEVCVTEGHVEADGLMSEAPVYCHCPWGDRRRAFDAEPKRGRSRRRQQPKAGNCHPCHGTGYMNYKRAVAQTGLATVADIREERGLELAPVVHPPHEVVHAEYEVFLEQVKRAAPNSVAESFGWTTLYVNDGPFDERKVIEALVEWFRGKKTRQTFPRTIRVLEGDFRMSETPDLIKETPGLICLSYVKLWVFEGDDEALIKAHGENPLDLNQMTMGVARQETVNA